MPKTRYAKDQFIEEWKDVFELSSDSPSGIVWKIDGNNKTKGKSVGWLCKEGYWKCEYKHKSVQVHRVVYYLSRGNLDTTKVVDHIDRNPSNNSVENLRLISYEENSRNRSKSKANMSGFTGVYEVHTFVATWVENGKNRNKSFSVLELGSKARQLAEEFRKARIEELNRKGHNYHDTHGQ